MSSHGNLLIVSKCYCFRLLNVSDMHFAVMSNRIVKYPQANHATIYEVTNNSTFIIKRMRCAGLNHRAPTNLEDFSHFGFYMVNLWCVRIYEFNIMDIVWELYIVLRFRSGERKKKWRECCLISISATSSPTRIKLLISRSLRILR